MAKTEVQKRGVPIDVLGDGSLVELQVSSRAEAGSMTTKGYLPGSEMLCTADWSLWVLGYQGGNKKWLEVKLG